MRWFNSNKSSSTEYEDPFEDFKLHDKIEYLGIKGTITEKYVDFISDSDLYWDGPSYLVLRYLDNSGGLKDITLYEKDLNLIQLCK